MPMREMGWIKRALRTTAMAVVALGLAGSTMAAELGAVSPLTTPRSGPGPSERPATLPDTETAAGERQEVSAPKATTDQPSLPTPDDDVEGPQPADGFLEEAFEEVVVQEQVIITLAPRPLRIPARLP